MSRCASARVIAAAAVLSVLVGCSARKRSVAAAHNRGVACAAWRDSLPSDGALVYLDGEVDRAVTLERQTPPVSAPHVDGDVLVRFVVAPDGRVDWESYAVLRSTDPALTAYVERLVGASVFTPAMLDGQPVRQCIVVPMTFTADR